jgi:hypothetical protein
MRSFLQLVKTRLQWNYSGDLLLAVYTTVLEKVPELILRENIPAKNMTQLLPNAFTKWHPICPCTDVH